MMSMIWMDANPMTMLANVLSGMLANDFMMSIFACPFALKNYIFLDMLWISINLRKPDI